MVVANGSLTAATVALRGSGSLSTSSFFLSAVAMMGRRGRWKEEFSGWLFDKTRVDGGDLLAVEGSSSEGCLGRAKRGSV